MRYLLISNIICINDNGVPMKSDEIKTIEASVDITAYSSACYSMMRNISPVLSVFCYSIQ